jgi:hypothetical protein
VALKILGLLALGVTAMLHVVVIHKMAPMQFNQMNGILFQHLPTEQKDDLIHSLRLLVRLTGLPLLGLLWLILSCRTIQIWSATARHDPSHRLEGSSKPPA